MSDELPIRQRTVNAASAAPLTKPAGAAASVFDAAKQAKPARKRLPPLDPSKVEIRSDVPLPPPSTGPAATSPYDSLLSKMQPGQMVELEAQHAAGLMSRGKAKGVKLAARTLAGGRKGVWRLA